jgi:hypothetical protein
MSNTQSLIRRVQDALAEYASKVKMNGLADWDSSDFRVAAEKFVEYLDGAQLNADYLKLYDPNDYRRDAIDMLRWDVPTAHSEKAIDIALFEVGPELTGMEFDPA